MKKILLIIIFLLIPAAALANQKPTDVPPFVQQDIEFTDDRSDVYGVGSANDPSSAPYYAENEGPEPNDTGLTRQQLIDGGYFESLTGPPITDTSDKFRTTCAFGKAFDFDPILSFDEAGFEHKHWLFGNTDLQPDSTYAQLRESNAGSSCGGNLINNTAYWAPVLAEQDALGDGKDSGLKPFYITLYYQIQTPIDQTEKMSRIPFGLRYVAGFNPHDPENEWYRDKIAIANLPENSNSGYVNNNYNGFTGWYCLPTAPRTNADCLTEHSPNTDPNGKQPYLVDENGNPTLDVREGEELIAELVGPECWDGVNAWSPNGRQHVVYPVSASDGRAHCPAHWYRIPPLGITFHWIIDYGPGEARPSGGAPVPGGQISQLYLTSDRMSSLAMNSEATSPCLQISNRYCGGETMHTDWFGAWNQEMMRIWQANCTGVKNTDPNLPEGQLQGCGDNQYGDGSKGTGILGAGTQLFHWSFAIAGFDRYFTIPGGNDGTHEHSVELHAPDDDIALGENDNFFAGVFHRVQTFISGIFRG